MNYSCQIASFTSSAIRCKRDKKFSILRLYYFFCPNCKIYQSVSQMGVHAIGGMVTWNWRGAMGTRKESGIKIITNRSPVIIGGCCARRFTSRGGQAAAHALPAKIVLAVYKIDDKLWTCEHPFEFRTYISTFLIIIAVAVAVLLLNRGFWACMPKSPSCPIKK